MFSTHASLLPLSSLFICCIHHTTPLNSLLFSLHLAFFHVILFSGFTAVLGMFQRHRLLAIIFTHYLLYSSPSNDPAVSDYCLFFLGLFRILREHLGEKEVQLSLTFDAVDEADLANYTCYVENHIGKRSGSAILQKKGTSLTSSCLGSLLKHKNLKEVSQM